MPSALDDDEIEEICDAYQELGEYTKVAEATGHSRDTVKKYVEKHYDVPGGDAELDDAVEGTMPDQDETPSLFADPAADAAEAFKEFWERLNDTYETGIKEKAIRMMVGEVRDTGKLPQPLRVASRLDKGDTGVKNAEDIRWITGRYDQWLRNYQQVRGGSVFGEQQPPVGGMAGMYQQAGSTGAPSSSVPSLTDNGVPVGRQLGAQGQPQPGQPQPGGGVGAGGQQNMLFMMQQMLQELKDDRGGEGDTGKVERLRELKEEKELLEELSGPDEYIQQLTERIQGLEQALSQGADRERDQQPPRGDTLEDRLLALAQTGQVDTNKVIDMIEERSSVEERPEVLEKKYEKEIKEKELEARGEQMAKIGETLENLSEKFGDALGRRLAGEAGEAGDAPAGQRTATGRQGGPRGASPDGGATRTSTSTVGSSGGEGGRLALEGEDCTHCGGDMISAGNQQFCSECEYGYGPCDLCGYPVEVPPQGEAEYVACPSCDDYADLPDDPGGEAVCESCGTTGPPEEFGPEQVVCGQCDEPRPIIRAGEVMHQAQQWQSD